ncbi:MerR family transcriptional regulator [Brevibacillus humidisoli]|uniref:MerR family transcriptional regulator n=1 Tax=Brevibacillus humidisoli TaxID=2895522 RepID=UPI001E62AED4|nr:MerR family transcriptional regulator [Brevibacillus humidisoli]UFJ42889.1 MerR family transcriptional regulator [Brevibacillus humidisoli]
MDMISIKELKRKTGITDRTLRYYDSLGLLRPSGSTPGGHRLYSQQDIEKLYVILFLKQLGFRLSDIQQMLDMQTWSWESYLERQLQLVREQIAEWQVRERRLQEIVTIARFEGGLKTPLLYELIQLSMQPSSVRDEFRKTHFSEKERELILRLPNTARNDEVSREWMGLLDEARRRLRDDPASPEVQQLVERMIISTEKLLDGDEQLMKKLWDIRKSPEQSRQMHLYPLEPELLAFLDKAFDIYEQRHTK